jgi:hypothetical protein
MKSWHRGSLWKLHHKLIKIRTRKDETLPLSSQINVLLSQDHALRPLGIDMQSRKKIKLYNQNYWRGAALRILWGFMTIDSRTSHFWGAHTGTTSSEQLYPSVLPEHNKWRLIQRQDTKRAVHWCGELSEALLPLESSWGRANELHGRARAEGGAFGEGGSKEE